MFKHPTRRRLLATATAGAAASLAPWSMAQERTVRFIRQAPLPLPARPPYGVLFAGAVATLPAEQRRLLGLPSVPLALARPAVGALLGGMGAILGRQSPSQRNARRRVARLDVA